MREIDLVAACGHAHEIFSDEEMIDAVRQLHFIYGFDQKNKTVADLLSEVVTRSNYKSHLEANEKEAPEKIEERKRNVDELVNSIAALVPGQFGQRHRRLHRLHNAADVDG